MFVLRRLLELRRPRAAPLGRWLLEGDWRKRADMASMDHSYCQRMERRV